MARIKWTGYDLSLLRKEYPTKGAKIPELRKKFSKSSIVTKAHRLGIHYYNITLTKTHKWTKEDIDLLKKEYPSKGVNIPILIERHGKGGIDSKSQQLGIKCDFASKKWTKKEIDLLKKYYPDQGTKIPELLKTRTRKAIQLEARILGVPFEGEPEKNYDIPKEKLIELYITQQKPLDEIAILYNCSRDTIRNRMIEFDIPIRERLESMMIARGGYAHFELNDYVKQILDGVIISDGYIDITSNETACLVLNQAEKNGDWLRNLQDIFNNNGISCNIHKRKIVFRGKEFSQLCLQSASYVELGNERKRWYKKNKKIIPKGIKFTPVFLAHWYMGDGYLSIAKRHNKYYKVGFCTDCFTKEESECLAKTINKKYGYHFKVFKTRQTHRLELTKIQEVKDFLFRVSPYIVDCFQYKLKALYDTKSVYGRKRWTKKQDEILKREYLIYGMKNPSLLRHGRTTSAIKNRAKTLGIKTRNQIQQLWTEEDKKIIKSKFPELGTNISELKEKGYTKNAIQGKAKALGLKCNYTFNKFGKYKRKNI